jgi:tRNA (adenine37-N6)-methyltransferase
MRTELEPIGHVKAPRPHAQDDFWGGEQACIELAPQFAPDALAGLGEFSHIEVLFYFHQVEASDGGVLAAQRRAPTRVVARAHERIRVE